MDWEIIITGDEEKMYDVDELNTLGINSSGVLVAVC